MSSEEDFSDRISALAPMTKKSDQSIMLYICEISPIMPIGRSIGLDRVSV